MLKLISVFIFISSFSCFAQEKVECESVERKDKLKVTFIKQNEKLLSHINSLDKANIFSISNNTAEKEALISGGDGFDIYSYWTALEIKLPKSPMPENFETALYDCDRHERDCEEIKVKCRLVH